MPTPRKLGSTPSLGLNLMPTVNLLRSRCLSISPPNQGTSKLVSKPVWFLSDYGVEIGGASNYSVGKNHMVRALDRESKNGA
jgi:hypothetical protein